MYPETTPTPLFPSPGLLLRKQYPIYPFLGLVATFLGTWIALVLIPNDPYPAGALLSSAVAMSIGLAIVPAIAGFRSPQTLLRAEHLLILAPIYWLLLDLLQAVYDLKGIDHQSIEATFMAIGLFVAGIWISAIFRPWQLPKAIRNAASYRLTPPLLFRLILIFFGIGMFKFAYACNFNPVLMVFYLGQNRWAAPWARGALGGTDAFLDHLSYFGYLLPTLTVLLAVRKRKLDFRLVIAIVLTLIMGAFLAQGGGRRVIGVIFGAGLICWILEQQKLKIQQFLVALFSTILLLTTMQYILEFRGVGFQAFFEGNKELQYEHLHVDDNFLRLGQIIDLVPDHYPHVYEKQIVYTLVRPIPRVFWPGKPTSPGFDLSEAAGKQGTSLSSSVIGEWYLGFGWFGVLLGGWLYGRLAGIASLLLVKDAESAGTLVYSLMAMALFAGVRSMLDLVLMSYALIAWVLVSQVLLRGRHISDNQS